MRLVLIRSILVAWLLLCTGLASAQDGALYEGEAPVADQSEEQRIAALPRALAQVLVKVTGDAGAANDGAFSSAYDGAAGMLQQYRYRQDVDTSSGAPQLRLFLIARFNRAAIDALVGRAGRTVWPTPRPKPLLWLAIDDGHGARLVGEAQASAVAALSRRATERGFALAYPKADLQDQTLGGAQSIWRDDFAAVRSAAARYGQAPVLVGRMERAGAGWSARYVLLHGEREIGRWSASDADARVVLAAGADGAAAALAQNYSTRILAGPAGDYDIEITGLAGATDYARVLQYLQGLPIVAAVQVVGAQDDRVQLRVSLRAGIEGLARLIEADRVLQAPATPAPADAPTVFRLER
jgi:hypothetical protein